MSAELSIDMPRMVYDMQQITTKLPDHTIESLDQLAAEEYDGNRSEAIRDLITKALDDDDRIQEYEEEIKVLEKEYEERIEELENEGDRLHRQLAATNQRVDQHQELVEYVENQREMEREHQEREQRRRKANIFKRGWWLLAGEPEMDRDE